MYAIPLALWVCTSLTAAQSSGTTQPSSASSYSSTSQDAAAAAENEKRSKWCQRDNTRPGCPGWKPPKACKINWSMRTVDATAKQQDDKCGNKKCEDKLWRTSLFFLKAELDQDIYMKLPSCPKGTKQTHISCRKCWGPDDGSTIYKEWGNGAVPIFLIHV